MARKWRRERLLEGGSWEMDGQECGRAEGDAGSTAKSEKSWGQLEADQDENRALNVFWAPPAARWSTLQAQARQATIGQTVDGAISATEGDKTRLGRVVDLVSNIKVVEAPQSPQLRQHSQPSRMAHTATQVLPYPHCRQRQSSTSHRPDSAPQSYTRSSWAHFQ